MNISQIERERRSVRFGELYDDAIPKVSGGVVRVLRRPEVRESWIWSLTLLSLDISQKLSPPLIDDLSAEGAIAGLIGRAGARVAIPTAFVELQAAPQVKFWTSHATGRELPNPFHPDTLNVTEQAFIRQTLGENFARELEIDARGGRSYSEEFERRQHERLAEDAAKYDGPNPFEPLPKGANLTKESVQRSEAARRIQELNPFLADYLKGLAQPVALNPWEPAPAWNLTRQVQIETADPGFAGLLRRTADWRASQLDHELRQAEVDFIAAQRRIEEAKNRSKRR